MFNADETYDEIPLYFQQYSGLGRILVYIFGAQSICFFARQQLPEVNLIQFVPGFALFIYFFFLILFICSSFLFSFFYRRDDYLRKGGLKNIKRINRKLGHKSQTLVCWISNSLSFLFFLPFGLDSFTSYTLSAEKFWSATQFFSFELSFLLITNLFYQSPFFILSSISKEQSLKGVKSSWRFISLFNLISSAIVTPTFDAITQINFFLFFSILSSFFFILLQKRLFLFFPIFLG